MAHPHLSHLPQPTTRPCWNCGTPHESDNVPALCSDDCTAAWAGLYHLTYAEPAEILSGPMSPSLVKAPVTAAGQVRNGLRKIQINPPVKLNAGDQVVVHTNHDCDPVPAPLRTPKEPAAAIAAIGASAGTLGAAAFARVPAMTAALNAALAAEQQANAAARGVDEPQDLAGSSAQVDVALQPKPRPSWWRWWLRRG